MLEKIPSQDELQALIGKEKLIIWNEVCNAIDAVYDMDTIWNNGGKHWTYEYKYRRGGKTLCTLYAKENCLGVLVIFGQNDRENFESDRSSYADVVQTVYDSSTTYHDGKWMMLQPADSSWIADIMKLLRIKRKPNRK